MLISALLNLIYSVLSVLLVFNLPDLPESISTIVNSVLGYVQTGIQVLYSFLGSTCIGVLTLLLTLVISLHGAYMLYSVVMWVLRKVPMLAIKE